MVSSYARAIVSLLFLAACSGDSSANNPADSSVGSDSAHSSDSPLQDSTGDAASTAPSIDSVSLDSTTSDALVDSLAIDVLVDSFTADTTGTADSAKADTAVTDSAPADTALTDTALTDTSTDSGPSACGAGDKNLPAEPTIPPACATLSANRAVSAGTPPAESNYDTARLQDALTKCTSGQAVRLVTSGNNNAFLIGQITLPTGVTLWVDSGVTLYGSRDMSLYSSGQLITVTGTNSGIVGDGVIDGQGGEPSVGSAQSPWDVNGGGGSSPSLIRVTGAKNFTLYRIRLQNSPMFHVKLGAAGFVVWGVTIKTPSSSTNSVGTALTPATAHNTDGIDPGQAASDGTIVCTNISTGDDDVAIKGATGVKNLTIAHNRFKAGHGMSIGSEINGGVDNVNIYDLSVDAQGMVEGSGTSNSGIRIKSDPSRGGPITNITYSDICVRGVQYPIEITPKYSALSGSLIPSYSGITIKNFYAIAGAKTPIVQILGYDGSHITGVTLDNVVINTTPTLDMANANITLGPGAVSFTPTGTGVTVTDKRSGASTPNPCTNKWVTF